MFIKVDLDEPFIDGEGGQIWELTGDRSFIYGAAYCRLPTATVPDARWCRQSGGD
jgi:hypothetical protein